MKNTKLTIGSILIAIGVLSFIFLAELGKPANKCVEVDSNGAPAAYSGFTETMADGSKCYVSDASYEEYKDWNSSPRWGNIVGALLVLTGIGFGIAGLVKNKKNQ